MSQPLVTPGGRMIPGWLVLLGALTALAPLSIDMYLPALPAIGDQLGASDGSMGLTLSSFFIGMALGQLFYGPLSDRFGRKKPLYAGLALYVLASVACVFAENLTQLVAARFLQALGGCAGPVIARAVVRDRCNVKESAQAFSMLMLVMGLAPILAPLLGGLLLEWVGWRWLFLALGLFGAACLAVVHWRLAESHDTRHAAPLSVGSALADYWRLLKSPVFMGYVLCSAMPITGMFGYITGSSFLFIDLHGMSPTQYSVVFGSNAAAFILASQINARILRRVELSSVLRKALWAPLLAGIGLMGVAFIEGHAWYWLWLGCMVFLGGMGFVTPNASALALATHGQQAGTASALMGSLQFLLATIASMVIGVWHDGTALPLAAVMLVCSVCGWLAYHGLVRTRLHG